jgi:hypothetical protein
LSSILITSGESTGPVVTPNAARFRNNDGFGSRQIHDVTLILGYEPAEKYILLHSFIASLKVFGIAREYNE